jgi:hypothetical protein
MLALLELQLITRPVRTLLFASRVTALSCTVPPTCKFAVPGDTDTDATGAGAGALTVIVEDAVWPSLVAVICTVPAAMAVASPSPEIVPMLALLELHVITRPVSTLLLASRVTASSWTVPPTCNVALGGETDTDATGIGDGTLTVNAAFPVWPSLEALIVAVPGPMAAISPVAATDAMLEFELCHVTVRPESGLPPASLSVAVARAVCPIINDAGLIATNTVATGVGGGAITDIVA